jgi:hypothetical protein
MPDPEPNQLSSVSRRHFVKTGAAATVAGLTTGTGGLEAGSKPLNDPESWLTSPNDFRNVSRGKPVPHSISEEKRRQVALTRDTWRLRMTLTQTRATMPTVRSRHSVQRCCRRRKSMPERTFQSPAMLLTAMGPLSRCLVRFVNRATQRQNTFASICRNYSSIVTTIIPSTTVASYPG